MTHNIAFSQEEFPTPLFELHSPEQTGIHFINQLPEDRYRNIIAYQYYYNGGGVAIADFDNDGLPDIFFTANLGSYGLYQNKGNFSFKDVTASSGLAQNGASSWSTGVATVDINSDGYVDLYISRSGNLQPENRKNLLFINKGNFQFEEVADEYGLDDPGYSIQSVFFDFDKDGDLDMYLANHGFEFFDAKDIPRLKAERHPYSGDKLYENIGGYYVDVSSRAGIKSYAFGYGLGIGVADLNRDGWEDIYVSNDFFEHDYLYINNRDGTFSEKIKTATRHISNFSMGNDIADFNNDGWPDIMVLDMVAEDNRRLKSNMSGMDPQTFWAFVEKGYHYQYMFNTLHLNRGNGTFSEIAQLAGVSNTDWSWAPLWADFDNDGYLDLFITNGLRKDARNTDFRNHFKAKLEEVANDPSRNLLTDEEWRTYLELIPSEKIPNYAFKNSGSLVFEKVSEVWGLSQPSWSNGAAYGDLDQDGDLDLVVNNIDQEAFIYENHTENSGSNYVRVSLEGDSLNTLAIGAKLKIVTEGLTQFRHVQPSRGYQSSVEPDIHVGLGRVTRIELLEVNWPDGSMSQHKDLPVNQTIHIKKEQVVLSQVLQDSTESYFQHISPQMFELTFVHKENEFDDFQREILLPHKMSQWGPKISVADVNGDGLEDFYIGGAKGQSGVVYVQEQGGTFLSYTLGEEITSEDMGSAFFDADGDGDLDLWVVSGGNEAMANSGEYRDRLYINDGQGNFTLSNEAIPDIRTSGSCVRPMDWDQDNDIDVFVGGRQTPGTYPLSGQSYLLENRNGIFYDVTEAKAPGLKEKGMITDAQWKDIDKDGDEDLVVVGEWLPLIIWVNEGDVFEEKHILPKTEGWWNCVEIIDIDGDGDEDIIGGNLGLNYKYKASDETPFELYYADFDQNGKGDIVLSYYQNGEQYPLRGKSCSSQQIPSIKNKFPTYNLFSEANMEEIYGDMGLDKALNYKAYSFASSWFEQLPEGEWKRHDLPLMAQLSSIQSIVSDDINDDGNLDLILGGNMYGSEIETPRNDAACGLVLLGIGGGEFQVLSVKESGLYIPGDVRDIQKILIDNKSCLLVGNNDGPLEIFILDP